MKAVELLTELDCASEMIIEAFRCGKKLLVCGNGGSASDSAHIVGELVKGFLKKRPIPAKWQKELGGAPLQMGLPAFDLTAQSALISAVNNDLGGDLVYAQQVMAYGDPGDVLLGISTSGNANNVVLAAKTAKLKGMHVIGLTGDGGGNLLKIADETIKAPASETYQIQEWHIRYYHEMCIRVERAFFID